jgi:PAS domain S-box-containing protein
MRTPVLLLTDPQGAPVFASENAAVVFGYSPHEMVAGWSLERVHPDDREVLQSAIDRALADGGRTPITLSLRFRHKLGHWVATHHELSRVGLTGLGLAMIVRELRSAGDLEAWHAMTFDAMPQALVVVDRAGAILEANRHAHGLFGVEAGKLVGRSLSEFVPEPHRETHLLGVARAANAPVAGLVAGLVAGSVAGSVAEVTLLRGDGDETPVRIHVTDTILGDQRCFPVFIEDLKPARQLDRRAADLRRAVEIGRLGFWSVDLSTGVLYQSDELAELVGERPGDPAFNYTTPVARSEAMHPDDIERVHAAYAKLQPDATRMAVEYRLLHAKGGYFEVRAEAELVLDRGVPVRLEGVTMDVSRARQHERAFVRAEGLRSAMFAAIPDPVLVYDVATGVVVESNDAAREVLGDVVGQPVGRSVLVIPSESGGWVTSEAIDRHGQLFAAEVRLQLVRLETGSVNLLVVRNLEERARLLADLEQSQRELEHKVDERTEALRHANEDLQRALRVRDEFLASMSHELRTPLNGILGLSEALREAVYGEVAPAQASALARVEQSGRHLLELINDILDLSKLEAKRMALEFEDVVVDEVAEAAMTIVRPTARKKRIALSTTWASRGRFACDARRVRQILVNLLGNAIKFTGEGGRVELLVEDALDEDAIRFTVEDSGIGIAPHDLARLFQPFVQVDGRLTRRHEGTGLGLALVRRLAELHGGRVEATSESGKGSRFSVVLPVDPRAVPDQRVSRTSLQPARLEAPEDAR